MGNNETFDCPYQLVVKDKRESACLYSSTFESCEGRIDKRQGARSVSLFENPRAYDLFYCEELETEFSLYGPLKSQNRRAGGDSLNAVGPLKVARAEAVVKEKVRSKEISRKEGTGRLILLKLWPGPIKDSKQASQFDPDFSRRIAELAREGRLVPQDFNQGVFDEYLNLFNP